MDAMVKAFTVASLSEHDVVGDELISAMGVSAALGWA